MNQALSVGWAQPAPQIPNSGGCQLNETHPHRHSWPDAPFAHHTPKPGTENGEILQDCIYLPLPGDTTLRAIKKEGSSGTEV